MITKRSLRKFKALYEKHFGEKLTNDEATRKATSLIEIYRAIYGKPEFEIPEKKHDE